MLGGSLQTFWDTKYFQKVSNCISIGYCDVEKGKSGVDDSAARLARRPDFSGAHFNGVHFFHRTKCFFLVARVVFACVPRAVRV